MSAYFEHEGNLGSKEVLVAAAVKGGLDEAAVTGMLATDEKVKEVRTAAAAWQGKHRITGVPFFVIDGKYRLSGAQEPATFVEAFQALAEA